MNYLPTQVLFVLSSSIPLGHEQVSTELILPQVWLHPWLSAHLKMAKKCFNSYNYDNFYVSKQIIISDHKIYQNHITNYKIF